MAFLTQFATGIARVAICKFEADVDGRVRVDRHTTAHRWLEPYAHCGLFGGSSILWEGEDPPESVRTWPLKPLNGGAARFLYTKNPEYPFWFADHGMQIKGENYLAAVGTDADNEIDVKHSCRPLNRIIETMERSGTPV